jgi:hypothetical protein
VIYQRQASYKNRKVQEKSLIGSDFEDQSHFEEDFAAVLKRDDAKQVTCERDMGDNPSEEIIKELNKV